MPPTIVIIATDDPELVGNILDLVTGKTKAAVDVISDLTQVDANKATAILAQANKQV